VLDRRLGNNSSEFSNTGIDDVIACLQGFTQLLSATDHGQGMLSLINNTQLVETWQQQLASLNSTLLQWQEQGMASQELSQQVRSQFIELLSLLEKTADALSMRLPRLDELSRR
jgi:ABC-type transporter Mla subunit MlaD